MKRIVICCDGTWQDLETPVPTNVVKMAQAIKPFDDKGIYQALYYDAGVGTNNLQDKLGGGAFGWWIDDKIKNAYSFLCLNYEEGDEIYLFGFSRGAYTVRCLAGLIYCSGLLHREFIRKVPDAYRLYRERLNQATKPGGSMSVGFRQKYAREVPIKVLGCWDTVGAMGIPDLIPNLGLDKLINDKYKFFDAKVNRLIQNVFHAVAIDEIRIAFPVTLMERADDSSTKVKEVWFPGEHGCVGGGTKETQGLSDAALEWMMEQVEPLGLALDRSNVENGISPDHMTKFDNRPESIFEFMRTEWREFPGSRSDLHESATKRLADPNLKYDPPNLKDII